MRTQLKEALDAGLSAIEEATDLAGLEDARVRALGRKSPLSRARSGLGKLTEDERREVGKIANDVQTTLEGALEDNRARFAARELQERFERERIDVTLPGEEVVPGAVHPLTRTIWEIVDIFIGLGYRVVEGPDVEMGRLNFDALNFPANHPSRGPTDTFYVGDIRDDLVLRTHTSPAQIRTMQAQQPPVYVVVPGRTYRRDAMDATHLASFAQIEGLAVDEGITMADLKGSLQTFARQVFGKDLEVRLRPHHFSFTEPSAEMDVQCFVCRGRDPKCRLCKGEGWIEILGCGMVHPFLFEWVGYDTARVSGFAFGMGVERIAALSHGIADIRYFYDNDLRFLSSFTRLV
ncbi:MAG: phenylalanine--tRNA ligase subunit alpha [Actinomycetota bacterium]